MRHTIICFRVGSSGLGRLIVKKLHDVPLAYLLTLPPRTRGFFRSILLLDSSVRNSSFQVSAQIPIYS